MKDEIRGLCHEVANKSQSDLQLIAVDETTVLVPHHIVEPESGVSKGGLSIDKISLI